MLGLVVGERAGQGEAAALGTRVAAAREVEVDQVRRSEGGVALDDEDGVTADDDRQRDAGQLRDGLRPESRCVDDHRRVDALARRGLHARDAAAGRAYRDDLDALLDADTATPSRLGIADRHRGRVAVARIRLVEDGAEMLGVDPLLDAGEITGLENLRPHAERTLEPHGLVELRSHRGGDADEDAAADVARLAADRLAEALKHRERTDDHLAGLGRRIELSDDADRSAGAARGEELALEHEHVAHACTGQMERDGGAGDAAPDDDDLGSAAHRDGAAATSATSAALSRRMGSPCLMEPGASTRA